MNELHSTVDASCSLPEEFDAAVCRANHPDLRALDDNAIAAHYAGVGAREGRRASAIASRSAFIKLIAEKGAKLEVGPFANPLLRGKQVKYLDVLPTEQLRARAVLHGVAPHGIPHIDFVSENGDFATVSAAFDAVLSSHVIEHQPDLVHHLNGAAGVLKPAGRYYLAIPDKRYCFDHFIDASNIAEIVAAHAGRQRAHRMESIIEHLALTTHNDCLRHWAGDHGEPGYKTDSQRIRRALESFERSRGGYLDVHAWQFTPESFRSIVHTLFELGLSPFRALRVYATVHGSNEFYAVLENTGRAVVPLLAALPSDFDSASYLRANPDVAQAGCDAVQHYLMFGRSEGRPLR